MNYILRVYFEIRRKRPQIKPARAWVYADAVANGCCSDALYNEICEWEF